jgi:hypothetical protein
MGLFGILLALGLLIGSGTLDCLPRLWRYSPFVDRRITRVILIS